MKLTKLINILGLVLVSFVLYSCAGTQIKADSKPPIITHSFAIERGYYGYVWKIYIEAEDPDGDMQKIVSTVHQPGWGNYFPDTILIKPQHRRNLKGYLQWNTFSSKTSYLKEFSLITLKVSVIDRAGNESNVVIFPFEFVSGGVAKYELPSPFGPDDPRLGYIHIDLYEPSFSGFIRPPEHRP
ncbi:MAG: hypothetical protein ACUVWO_04515 [Thermodesulfobacteriota bacterium]